MLLVLLCVALSACTTSSPPSRRAGETPTSSPTQSPSVDRPGGKAFDDGYAVWPQDTFAAAVEAPAEAWRDDPNAVAAQFATDVLGWKDARIRTLRFGLRTAHVEVIEPGVEGPLDVDLRSAPADTWSVLNVMAHGEYLPTVRIAGTRASVGVELDGDAVSADVTVGYGGDDRTVKTRKDGTVEVHLGKKPHSSGHFLVLARNSRGDVISATGSTLPAGNFVAS
ncbi:MAG: hypothetical protein ACJ76P_12795 [Actinomycetota bacterium]